MKLTKFFALTFGLGATYMKSDLSIKQKFHIFCALFIFQIFANLVSSVSGREILGTRLNFCQI